MREIHVSVQCKVVDGRVPESLEIAETATDYKFPDNDVTTLQTPDSLIVIHWENGVPANDFLRNYVDNAVLNALGYKRG
jgi:hypothetical protein